MSKKEKKQSASGFAFGKENYRIMIAGVVIILVGMLLMIGGGSDDPNVFNGEELFSFRRITLSPVVILLGFVVVVVAIMRKPKSEDDQPVE
jgi:fumarate reductase subunit D